VALFFQKCSNCSRYRNIFGNALKYTETGFIRISLKQVKQESKHDIGDTKIVLSVTDTGIGMSQEFLANHLYSPFTQENSFSSGVGLGLNIVRQIVESISGNIDLTSDLNVGTEVSVTLSLPDPEGTVEHDEESGALLSIGKRMRGRSICILNKAATPVAASALSSRDSGPELLGSTLASTLEGWLGMSVVSTSEIKDRHGAEIVICTEPSFEHLAAIRERRSPEGNSPITIFLAIDAIEAAALRTDARVTSKESVVEIISQP